MLTINTNVNNLKLQRNLNAVNSAMQTATERMSTGFKINYASDDAAGLVISKALQTQTNGLNIANQNAQMATNILSVADGALSQMGDLTMRIRDLALQAANGGYSPTERNALELEAKQLTSNLQQLVEGTKFNEFKIFEGTQQTSHITEEEAIAQGYEVVKTADELNTILHSANTLNNSNKKVMLMADIDLSSISDWKAIGDWGNSFKGVFDGNGFAVSNLQMSTYQDFHGLFGHIDSATIKNIGLENVNISGSVAYCTGALVGYATGSSTITNSYSTGNVKDSSSYTGGLAGRVQDSSKITNSYSTANVVGSSTAGGFIGDIDSGGLVTNSYSTGNVATTSLSSARTGGFAGICYAGGVSDCYSIGQVSGANDYNSYRGSFVADIWGSYIPSSNSSLSQPGMNAVGNGSATGVTQQSSSWFNNVDNIKSTLGDNGTWDFSYLPPKLKWQIKPPSPNILTFQIGAEGSDLSKITVDTSFSLDNFFASFSTTDSARSTIEKCDTLLKQINSKRGEIGASSNIIGSIIEGNSVTNENLTASKSRIQDADIAKESASMVKNQILQNATSALLAQSKNMAGDVALMLLGGIRR